MTLYSSRNPRDLPWHAGQEIAVTYVSLDGEPGSIVQRHYAQHNPPNPILTDFREHLKTLLGGSDNAPSNAAWWVELLSDTMEDTADGWKGFGRSGLDLAAFYGFDYPNLTMDHVDHAIRVLTRLAALHTTTESDPS